MKRTCVVTSVALVFALASAAIGAPQETAVPQVTATQGSRLITVSGVLTDAGGQPRTGSVSLTFGLYVQQAGGEALWAERQVVTADTQGRYSVLLGATVAGGVPPELFGEGKAQWLGVQVEGEAELPRVLLVAVPYALRAADADTLGGKPLTAFVTSEELTKVVDERVASTVAVTPAASTTAGGGSVLLGNETGTNTWYGEEAANGTMTGTLNSFFGWRSGNATTTGTGNAMFGYGAGMYNTAGNDNAIFGAGAGYNTTTASGNAFFGQNSGSSNTTGSGNAFFGRSSGLANTTGFNNTFLGYDAGLANSTSYYNTFVGHSAGLSNSAGNQNTFVGHDSGRSTTASYNTFFGRASGRSNTTGYDNIAVGWGAGYSNTTGHDNVFLGDSAGYNGTTTQSYNTVVGSESDVAGGVSNAAAIGYAAYVTQSNSLVLGGIAGVNSATADTWVGIGTTAPTAMLHVTGDVRVGNYLRGVNDVVMGSGTSLPSWSGNVELNNETGVGFHFRALNTRFDIGTNSGGAPLYPGLLTLSMFGRVGIGTTDPQYKLHVVGDIWATGTIQSSDRRLKEQIVDLGYGLREVLQLRPVSYHLKDHAVGTRTLGLIAQEVEPVLPELVGRGQDEAGMLGLNYTGLVPVLIKAMQEQQETIGEFRTTIGQQQANLDQKIAEVCELRARLAALEEQVARLLKSDGRQPR